MTSIRSSRVVVRSLERATAQARPYTIPPSYSMVRQPQTHSCRRPVSRHHLSQIQRAFSTQTSLLREEAPNPSSIPPPKSYTYQEVHDLTTNPSSNRILIDVREPSELLQTGRIPTAKSVPISSAPDAFFMSEEDFETKFGFPRPGEKDEVIFYCKAGVRSRQAALLAGQAVPAFGGKIGNYSGSWLDWEKNGGEAEKEGQQGEQSTVTGITDPSQSASATHRP